jgi:hypothetical protein
MSLGEQIIFPPNLVKSSFSIHKPTTPVTLYTSRTNLFGVKSLGDYGLYHSGLLFKTSDATWVIDLAIEGNFANILPYLDDQKKSVKIDNLIILEYYSPETKQKWGSYWNDIGDPVCTISPSQYEKLIDTILKNIGPKYNKYLLFSITAKPYYTIEDNQDKIISTIFASDNTCDKLPMRCYEWLNQEYGIEIKPFAITRLALTTPQDPIPINDMKDPGLVKYTQEIQQYVGILSSLHNKDVNGLIKIYREIMAQKNDFNYFEYVLALNNTTNTQQWYKLPTRDVSISAEDMYFKLPKSGSNRCVLFVLIAMVVLIALLLLLFLIRKKQD